MAINVGDKLPKATLRKLGDGGIEEIGTDALTSGKKVVLFAVPGAFTPTCSEQHLPGFMQHADAIKAKGVDTIACVTVNDPFVVAEWSKATNAGGKVDILSDGNGEFTKAAGMELDASGFGLGVRSQRYAMIVDDGVVKTLLVEDVPTQAEQAAPTRFSPPSRALSDDLEPHPLPRPTTRYCGDAWGSNDNVVRRAGLNRLYRLRGWCRFYVTGKCSSGATITGND